MPTGKSYNRYIRYLDRTVNQLIHGHESEANLRQQRLKSSHRVGLDSSLLRFNRLLVVSQT
ncbi:hypothetical protein RvY_15525 [Ramazzottius varieornatus]|uniref:Uncharacterized protein n=1 Tax=Ramazzottius varieornatus TaxID=947166 RepID=A0A1D1VYG6_RAMVA|nr:hypothetical protein RvY_15525 [Ramazzottius varieornatus]